MKILVLAMDEVLRLFSTKRGLLSLIGFGLIWAVVLMYGVLPAARFVTGASQSGLMDFLMEQFNLDATELWPTPELTVYWITCLYLLPALSILTSADQTASDRARGTLRYLVLRCGRLEIFFGRYLGQLVIMLGVVLITLGSVLAIIAFNSSGLMPESLASAPSIIVSLMLLLAPYIALMALVSVLARSARQATLYATIIYISLWLLVGYLKASFPDAAWLDWTLPGSQISELVWLSGWDTLSLAPIPIAHTLLFLALGAVFMKQRDL